MDEAKDGDGPRTWAGHGAGNGDGNEARHGADHEIRHRSCVGQVEVLEYWAWRWAYVFPNHNFIKHPITSFFPMPSHTCGPISNPIYSLISCPIANSIPSPSTTLSPIPILSLHLHPQHLFIYNINIYSKYVFLRIRYSN